MKPMKGGGLRKEEAEVTGVKTSERQNVKGGARPGTGVKTGRSPRGRAMRTSSRSTSGRQVERHGPERTARRRGEAEEADPLRTKRSLRRRESQGCYRHETRPERSRTEKSVKRLRKPEDEAEPGEAILARVAVHHLMHRREEKPTGRAMSSVKDDVSDRMSNSGREANDRSGRSSAQARGQLHD